MARVDVLYPAADTGKDGMLAASALALISRVIARADGGLGAIPIPNEALVIPI
jgi:hypothetical protein